MFLWGFNKQSKSTPCFIDSIYIYDATVLYNVHSNSRVSLPSLEQSNTLICTPGLFLGTSDHMVLRYS